MVIGVSSSAVEFSQPEYIGAYYGVAGGPKPYEYWRTDKCVLKNNEKMVFGSGENKLTFKIELTDAKIPKYNYHYVKNIEMYIGEDEKPFYNVNGVPNKQIYLIKSDNGDRHFVFINPPISDEAHAVQIYTYKASGMAIEHFNWPIFTKSKDGYVIRFEDNSLKALDDKIIIKLRGHKFGFKPDGQKVPTGELVLTLNENAQLFEYSTSFDE